MKWTLLAFDKLSDSSDSMLRWSATRCAGTMLEKEEERSTTKSPNVLKPQHPYRGEAGPSGVVRESFPHNNREYIHYSASAQPHGV